MQPASHRARIRESVDVIEESITRGLVERQRTIGFHTSVSAVDMLELYLHELHVIDPGAVLKHEWFTSERRIAQRVPWSFEGRDKILPLLIRIESRRNLLCYSTPREEQVVEEVLVAFQELRKVFRRFGIDGI
ncbi:MAG: hypothetical protein QF415_05080 [Candidatus Undinarchaeales archaeon]|jgi:hypothetical protein|nr:hypothetical protein [Candidatus Undinarchaeales archaeon]MDP7494539.1 hypothetical protein [Candidatus Undinarchaeales archaeon]